MREIFQKFAWVHKNSFVAARTFERLLGDRQEDEESEREEDEEVTKERQKDGEHEGKGGKESKRRRKESSSGSKERSQSRERERRKSRKKGEPTDEYDMFVRHLTVAARSTQPTCNESKEQTRDTVEGETEEVKIVLASTPALATPKSPKSRTSLEIPIIRRDNGEVEEETTIEGEPKSPESITRSAQGRSATKQQSRYRISSNRSGTGTCYGEIGATSEMLEQFRFLRLVWKWKRRALAEMQGVCKGFLLGAKKKEGAKRFFNLIFVDFLEHGRLHRATLLLAYEISVKYLGFPINSGPLPLGPLSSPSSHFGSMSTIPHLPLSVLNLDESESSENTDEESLSKLPNWENSELKNTTNATCLLVSWFPEAHYEILRVNKVCWL